MQQMIDRLRSGEARVGVVGLGYVGLPLCRAFAEAGLRVLGFDVDPVKVDAIEAGRSYIDAVPTEVLAPLREADRVRATVDISRVAEVDAIAICVPTPLTKHREPDTSYVEKTGEAIAPHLSGPTLVVLESTTYPGTTAELLAPILVRGSSLTLGQDLLVAYSPEREDPGNAAWSTRRIPKVVGADDPASREAVTALYERAVEQVVAVSSTRAAEATKLLENIYRCVNIALVNELKVTLRAMDVDVFEVIEAAKTKPFGFQAFYPGPGLGGHCIPIDPFYLSWKAREYGQRTRFIDLAGEVNVAMPEWVVERVMDALNDARKPLRGSRVLMLGVAYKKNVDDVRESPALALIDVLSAKGAEVCFHDPHVPRLGSGRHYSVEQESVPLTPERLAACDLALIVTDHDAIDYGLVVEHAPLVVDTRNATRDVRAGRSNVRLA